jgi:hypothetical protein
LPAAGKCVAGQAFRKGAIFSFTEVLRECGCLIHWIFKGVSQMEKAQQNETELAVFIKEVRENFASAGKPKAGWLSTLLKKIFG